MSLKFQNSGISELKLNVYEIYEYNEKPNGAVAEDKNDLKKDKT